MNCGIPSIFVRPISVLAARSKGGNCALGRQELAVGDERLVGADNYWDCFGQAFDAVRLGYSGTRFRADAFAGFLVQPARRRLDPFDAASRISGFTIQFKTRGAGVLSRTSCGNVAATLWI